MTETARAAAMKILLIDDSKVTRYALRIELQQLGLDVETADSAEAGLEILKTQVPDAIFMDHVMPGLNGLEAMEIIRTDPRTAQIPIVLCASQEDGDFAALARRKGILSILPKSLVTERLPQIIAELRQVLAGTPPRAGGEPAAPPAPAGGLARSATAPLESIDPRALRGLIDERLEAGINKHLTQLVESLRRDLTEMLMAETRHLVDARLAELGVGAPPPVSSGDLHHLERRLCDEILPELITHRLSEALARERAEIVADLTQTLAVTTDRHAHAATSPRSAASPQEGVPWPSPGEFAQGSARLRQRTLGALTAVRDLFKPRHER
ncbi:response regulator [Thiocapsa imhoffii]|nr:response regulator [Thiocapsa imhoffii]